jgi:hypothetical protein
MGSRKIHELFLILANDGSYSREAETGHLTKFGCRSALLAEDLGVIYIDIF